MGRENRNHETLGLRDLAEELGRRIDSLTTGEAVRELMPDEFRNIDRGLYEKVQTLVPSRLNGKRAEKDWNEFAAAFRSVRPDLADLWPTKEERAVKMLAVAAQELAKFLEQTKPADFSSAWLKRENPDLFYQARFQCTDAEEKCDWNKILKHPLFPAYWQERWRNKRGEKTLHPADVDAAREAVAQHLSPNQTPGSAFFQKYLTAATFRRINDALPRTAAGGRDWNALYAELDKGLPPRPVETEGALEGLRLVLKPKTEGERARQEKILLSLIAGAKRGDTAAVKLLEKLFLPVINEWSKFEEIFKPYKEDPALAMAVLRWCAERYSASFPLSFVDYVKLHLGRRASEKRKA